MLDVTQVVRDGKAFTITTDLTNISGNTETAFLYLKNPSDSGKDILVTHFKFGVNATSVRTIVRVHANPTVTADGTSLTIANTLIKSGAPSSDMEAYKLPTVTDYGSDLNIDISPSNSPSKGLNRWYWMMPGNSLLVTIENSVSNASCFADIYWLEGI